MDAVIEYISAGLIICLVLGFAGQYAASMTFDKLSLIERDTTMGKADRVIDMLLLSTGQPADWGRINYYGEPEVLGLAIENSVKLYQLDPGKVRKLDVSSPEYIPPGRLRDLLGLSSSYYMAFKIFPFFNMTITPQVDNSTFSVTVRNQWGVPVANVRVMGACLNVSTTDIGTDKIAQFLDKSLEAHYATSYTNIQGECLLSFAAPGSSIIVVSNQLNMESVKTWPSLSPAIVGVIESSMGTVSGYNAETVSRNVYIEGLDYVARLVLWS